MQVYVNMWPQADFVRAVTQDPRAFKPAVLRRAATLASNSPLITYIDQLSATINLKTEEEEEMDVPEEFLDQLMFTVMEDPVMLPSSKAIVDRGTIVAHLLNNETDPFNRAPLTLDQLVPLPELKEKIQNYLKSNK